MKKFIKIIIIAIVIVAIITIVTLIIMSLSVSKMNASKLNEVNELIGEAEYTKAYNNAQELIESNLITKDNEAKALYYQAICLFMKEQKESSLKKLNRAYKLNPKFDRLSDIDAFNAFFEDYKRIKSE